MHTNSMKAPLIKLLVSLLVFIGTTASFWVQAQAPDTQARIDAINERLLAIQQRSAAVDDINKLEDLQRIYGYYTDKQLWDQVVDLFADDATLEIGTSGIMTGKDSIRQYLYSLSDNQQGPLEGEMYNHFQLQPVITLNDDGVSASARWRALMQLGSYGEGSGGQWGEGPFENEYVKEDGVWKIQKLHWYATFVGPYEGGWAKASKAYVDAYSAAEPGSESYSFPDVSRPAFHYHNPVSGN